MFVLRSTFVASLLLAGSALASSSSVKECIINHATGYGPYKGAFRGAGQFFSSPDLVKNGKGGKESAVTAVFEQKTGLVFTPHGMGQGYYNLAITYDSDEGDGTTSISTLKNEPCVVRQSDFWDEVMNINIVHKVEIPASKQSENVPFCQEASFFESEHLDTKNTFKDVGKANFESSVEVKYRLGATSPAIVAKLVYEEGFFISTAPAYLKTPKLAITYIKNEDNGKTTYIIPTKEGSCKVKDSQGWLSVKNVKFVV